MSKLKLEDPIEELVKGLALLPPRPCRGQNGTKVLLEANYFALKMLKEFEVHRYSIEIVPPPKESSNKSTDSSSIKANVSTVRPAIPKRLFPRAAGNAVARREPVAPSNRSAPDNSSAWPTPIGKKAEQVIKLFLDLPELRPYKPGIFTDFRANLFSNQKLPEQVRSLRVQYRAENNAATRPNALVYTVRLVENARSIDLSALETRFQGGELGAFQYDRQELIQALNILFLHYVRSSPMCIATGARKSFPRFPGQNHIPLTAKWDLKKGLSALRGSFSSVRVVDSNILVNVNLCHGAFYNTGSLESLIQDFGSSVHLRPELGTFLRGLRVGLNHYRDSTGESIPANRNVKTIVGLARKSDGMGSSDNPPKGYHRPRVAYDFAGPMGVSFWYEEGEEGRGRGRWITVSKYFNEKYNKTLDRELPVINVGSAKRPVYVGVEVCEVLHRQLYKRKLDGIQTFKMTTQAATKNLDTRNFIVEEGLQNVGLSSSNEQLKLFHIGAERNMIRVTGHRLEDPTLLYNKDLTESPTDGTWSMRDKQYRDGKTFPEKWSFLKLNVAGIRSPNNMDQVKAAMHYFCKIAEGNGLHFYNPSDSTPFKDAGEITIKGPDDPNLKGYLKSSVEDFKTELLVVILPRKDTRLYQAIKRFGDVEVGLHTVCVVSSKFCQRSESYYGNVALKVNLKLGGINHELQKDTLGIIEQGKTMIVGIDVTHPSPGSSSNCPSVAAMVASVDSKLGQWPAVLSLQETKQSTLAPGQEIVSGIEEMLKSRLNLWSRKAGVFPENILVYRDGVSEGQYKAVIEQEITGIEKCCQSTYTKQKQNPPRITFIVVAKRHHTRFFPPKHEQSHHKDRAGNPKNGTVVDNGVTDDRKWDFFLQSHTPLQGTARPAHYVVLKNEIFTQKEVEANAKQYANVADIIESLSYNLCWLYGRTTRSVSYCTPAYYADRACERARCYLSDYFDRHTNDGEPGEEPTAEDIKIHSPLEDTMFYM